MKSLVSAANTSDGYNPPVIQVSGVHLKLGGRTLIEGLDWQLADPGAYLVLGPTGSGKSLLARLLTGRQRPQRGSVLIDGLALYALFGGYAEPLFLAQAEVACREAEPLDLYLEAELAAAGEPPSVLEPVWAVLDEYIPQGRHAALDELAHGQVLLAQIALASVIAARVTVLDGHLTYLDQNYCAAAAELFSRVNREQDKFLVATASRLASYFPQFKSRFMLSGSCPLGIEVLEQRLTAARPPDNEPEVNSLHLFTTVSPVLRPGVTSGRNFTILDVLEDGLRIKLGGSLEGALEELRSQGLVVRRLDWETPPDRPG